MRGDVARARTAASISCAIGVLGIAIAVGFFLVVAGLPYDARLPRSPQLVLAGLGALLLIASVWSVVDHLLRLGTLRDIAAHPEEVTAEPVTLRRQPAARLRLADGRSIVIPTSERLPRGGGGG